MDFRIQRVPAPIGWLRWLAPAIVAGAGAILWGGWDSVPDRWIVHFNAAGVADGWTDKSPAAAAWPLGMALGIWAAFEGLAFLIRALRSRRQDRTPEVLTASSAVTADLLRLVAAGLAFSLGFLAVALPLMRPESPGALVVPVLAAPLLCVGLGLVRMVRVTRRLKTAGCGQGLEHCNGLRYRNPEDPRLWVPKPFGMGWTLNFAHPRAWFWMILILLLPLAAVVAAILTAQGGR